jgi:predicted DNA-binding transcriptional regulator AlpA
MLHPAEVAEQLSLSRSSVWRISSHAVAWPEAEILEWLSARPASTSGRRADRSWAVDQVT